MKNAIVKLGFCLLFFCAAKTSYAVGPTVTVTPVTTSPTSSTTVNFTVTFQRSVNGFDKNDITLGGAAAAGLTLSNITVTPASPAAVYNVQVDGLATNGDLTVSIPVGAATDATTPFEGTVEFPVLPALPATITFDNTKPRPTITQPGQSDPTTGGTQIKFTVTWTEPISSFPTSSISFSGSGTGGGTLSISSINEIAPNNKTKYEVFVDVDAANATGNQHVIMSIPAGGVTDPAGNVNLVDDPTGRDSDVVYAGVAPTIQSPPTAVPTEDGFIISGNVSFDGGLSSAQRGFVWKNAASVGAGDHKTQVGTGEGPFTGSAVTGLNDETQYFYRTWVDNGIGSIVFSSEQSLYTLSQIPSSHSPVTATAKSSGQIDLSFTKYASITHADGLIILRKAGSAPTDSDLKDGKTPVVGNMPLIIHVIDTDDQQNTYSDTDPTLVPGTTYYYAVVPFSWDDDASPNPLTYNYKEGFATDNAMTFSKSSIIAYTGTPTAIDYASYTVTDFNSASDGVSIASLTLYDGNNVTDDADGLYTELKSITIHVSNPSMIRRIAVNDGGTMHGEANLPASGDITFNIPSGNIQTKDNNATGSGSPDQFDIIASFDPAQVSDGAVITVTVTGATTWTTGGTPSGSEFVSPTAGGATTGSDYEIDVIATKFVYSGAPTSVNVGQLWGFTATLKDDNNVVDTNIGGTVTVSEPSLDPPTTAVAEVTKPVINGVVTFTSLVFADAGNKSVNLDASNWAGTNNGTLPITGASLGVSVTFGSPAPQATFCFNDATPAVNAADPTFETLNSINIKESDKADFAIGNAQTFSLMLPPGFIFNTLVTPTFTKAGSEISNVIFKGYTSNNIARIQYDISGITSGTKDEFTIIGLKVKYTSTTKVANQNITRVGGTAVQVKNSETDGKSHGILSADSGPTGVTFIVTTSGFNATETHFSKSFSGLVSLQPQKVSNGQNIDGTFTGAGIVKDQDNIWKFNPSALAPGIYDVVFTWTDDVGTEKCKSTITKQFEVYTTIINGLNASYCVYNPAVTLNGPSNFTAGGYFYNGLFYIFDPALYTQYASNADPYVWYDPFFGYRILPATSPGVYQFNPGDPTYTAAIAAFGGYVYIGYRKYNNFTLSDEYVIQPIYVYQRPTIDFTPTFTNGICATDGIVDLVSPQFDSGGTFDEFWSSVPGNPNRPAGDFDGVDGDRTDGFTFDPKLSNPAPATNNVVVQINYKHLDRTTGCSNQMFKLVNVWRKPPAVPTTLINIKAAANDTSGEFCQSGDPISSFTVNPANLAMFYKWYDAAGTAEVTTSGKTEFNAITSIPTTGGIPNVGLYNFNITNTEHRVPGFDGCESGLRGLTVEVFAPVTIHAGNPTTICQNNDVDLTIIGASITPASGTLDGTWTSTSTSPGTFHPNNAFTATVGAGALSYTPSAQEILDGQVTLRLRSNDPVGPCGFVEDFVNIRINPSITVTFPVSPVQYCATAKDLLVEGTVSNASLGFHWTVTDGDGDLDAGSDIRSTTKYLPTAAELNQGADIELTLTTDDPDGPSGPCPVVSNQVHLMISQRPIVVAGADFEICDDQVINITSRIPPNGNPGGDLTQSSATSVTWTTNGLGAITDPTGLNTTYDISGPAAAPEHLNDVSITFTVASDPPGGANVCPSESDQMVVTIHPRPVAPTPITPANYCVDDVVDLLRVVGEFPTWYNNADLQLTHKISDGNNELATSVTANVEKRVNFWVTQTTDKSTSFAGCQSPSVKMTIVVNPLPVPSFTYANRCLNDIMKFTNGSTLAQPVDPLEPARSITAYQWNFADGLLNTDAGLGPIPAGTQDGRTTDTYENPGHRFKNPGEYAVRLTAFTSDGCSATFTQSSPAVPVGPIPVADFAAAKLCDQDVTAFTSTSGLDSSIPTTYAWTFGDAASGTNTSALDNPGHKFTAFGTYNVSLTITTNLDCSDTFTKDVSIFPYIKDNFPYVENFEGNHGWVPEGKVIDGPNTTVQTSWNLLTSAGSIASDPDNTAGPKFWATHTNAGTDTYYYNNERSILYGPCVDMTKLARPVIALDYFNDTEDKGDGVYVEYLDESLPSPVWTRLGDNIGGLKWYDESSIGGLSLLGDIGQTVGQFGWSGHTDNWTTGRYNLDVFSGSTRLRFRIVFGSNFSPVNTDTYDGFALDYFRLESRNRVVLVENFTSNSSSPVFTNNRNAFNAFPSSSASSEVVKIEYHTGLPIVAGDGPDPIFTQNPMDPNARASFYGLSAVPRGYIDGYSNLAGAGAFNTGNWAATYYSTESLKTSPLAISFTTTTITNGTLRVAGTINATDIDLMANKYSLYVAIVEQTVGDDSYVLRKMLPSASGRKVPLTAKGGSFTFDETWNIDRSYLGQTPNLVAVAFVQSDIINSDNERQVLQAAYKMMPPIDNFTTGVEVPFLEQTAMYPNLADRLVTIELPQPTATGVNVKVIDQLGRPVIESEIAVGQHSVSIDTGALAGTVYIIQLKENGVYTTRRLLVTHKH